MLDSTSTPNRGFSGTQQGSWKLARSIRASHRAGHGNSLSYLLPTRRQLQTASTFSLHREPLLRSTVPTVTSHHSIRSVVHNNTAAQLTHTVAVWEQPFQLSC